MIYIATVHFQTNRWIWPQLKYLNKYLTQPHEIYACCNGVEPGLLKNYAKCFSTKFSSTGSTNHGENLNFLAQQILKVAKPQDILVFLDGDAFPISPAFETQLDIWMQHVPLAAMRRDGISSLIPHPAFCVTTAGFWKQIQGDWLPASWVMLDGTVVLEPGTKVFKRLTTQKLKWHSVRRTNMLDLDKVYFGVYGNVVYHHGAGFRPYSVPDFHSNTGAHTQYIATASEIVMRMMELHDDFFRVFTEEKYLEVLEAALKNRGYALP